MFPEIKDVFQSHLLPIFLFIFLLILKTLSQYIVDRKGKGANSCFKFLHFVLVGPYKLQFQDDFAHVPYDIIEFGRIVKKNLCKFLN